MVLGREFKSRFHLKTIWKKTDHLMAENITKNIKDIQLGQVTPKNILKGNEPLKVTNL